MYEGALRTGVSRYLPIPAPGRHPPRAGPSPSSWAKVLAMATAITQTETLLTARVEDTITKLKGGCGADILPRRPTVADSSPDIIISHSGFIEPPTVSTRMVCSSDSSAIEPGRNQTSLNSQDPSTPAGTLPTRQDLIRHYFEICESFRALCLFTFRAVQTHIRVYFRS